MRASKSRSGFTLVELLVAVAIVVVLAGLLVPVVGGALAAGRQSVCVSNLRQIGLAWAMYVEDHDWQPPSLADLVDTRYLAAPQILVCPSDPTGDLMRTADPTGSWGVRYPSSYLYLGIYARELQRAVLTASGSRGIAACVAHGRVLGNGSGIYDLSIADFDGLKLRLCEDGAVLKRNRRSTFDMDCRSTGARIRWWTPWFLFTDLPLEKAPLAWRDSPQC